MLKEIPQFGATLSEDQISFMQAFTKSCRHTIVSMLKNSQSGHPGGSLSSLDYLATLYAFILSQTGEQIVVSHGHISPAVYSVLAELSYIPKEDVIESFRKFGSPYEGHVSRHVPGIFYGTGPLGVGVSAAASFALAEKLKGTSRKAYALMGDGEMQEGQVYEMINFAAHHKLDNLVLFVDYNKVQLTDKLSEVQNINIPEIFKAGGFEVIETDAHDFQDIWAALSKAHHSNKPVCILGHSIMGKGVPFMEVDGAAYKSDWHGKPPKPEQADDVLPELKPNEEEYATIQSIQQFIKWKPEANHLPESLTKMEVDTGEPALYDNDNTTDCRSAYGKALADLAERNPKVLALSADLKGSNMTKFASEQAPAQHIECGIAEQNMATIAGGLSLNDFIPFASSFGAFLTSRPKDQNRVNDINNCNVKLVATHCGLSVGEDGPTHQAIDDAGIMLGHYHTMPIEPADPNQCDRMIRYIASHYGNFYVRMGRHKIAAITKEDGSPFYDKSYQYEYGKCDLLREGDFLTIAATGSLVEQALRAREILQELYPNFSIEVIAISSIKKFDQTLINSIEKTKKVITVEDHNPYNGLGSQLASHLLQSGIAVDYYHTIGTRKYELSGAPADLWKNAGVDAEAIAAKIEEYINSNL